VVLDTQCLALHFGLIRREFTLTLVVCVIRIVGAAVVALSSGRLVVLGTRPVREGQRQNELAAFADLAQGDAMFDAAALGDVDRPGKISEAVKLEQPGWLPCTSDYWCRVQ
jgi:hypothetical protein